MIYKIFKWFIKSLKPFFNVNFFYKRFFSYIKMSEELSAWYYQRNKKKKDSKKGLKRYQDLKNRKTNSSNMVANKIKISQKIKNKD